MFDYSNLFDTASGLLPGMSLDLGTIFTVLIFFQIVVCAVELFGGALMESAFNKITGKTKEERQEHEEYEQYAAKREKAEKFANKYSADHDFTGPPEPSKPRGDGVYFPR